MTVGVDPTQSGVVSTPISKLFVNRLGGTFYAFSSDVTVIFTVVI